MRPKLRNFHFTKSRRCSILHNVVQYAWIHGYSSREKREIWVFFDEPFPLDEMIGWVWFFGNSANFIYRDRQGNLVVTSGSEEDRDLGDVGKSMAEEIEHVSEARVPKNQEDAFDLLQLRIHWNSGRHEDGFYICHKIPPHKGKLEG